jgi:DNA repair exonuclease SbcCD ATPase subunit
LRLAEVARAEQGRAEQPETPDRLNNLLTQLVSKDKELATADSELKSAEQAFAESQMVEQSVDKRLNEFGMATGENREPFLERVISGADAALGNLLDLQRLGESLSLRLSQSAAVAATDDLRREGDALRRDQDTKQMMILARNKTGDLAQRIIEALRETASSVVQERLHEITPLLQSIWTRIDPHPAFRVVSFFSQIFRGKGQLSTMLTDPIEDKESVQPAAVLSSSQLNALAVSVFLALNLGIARPPLDVAMLDDPLQSLDDVNLLGLVDLFRRTRGRRQLLISTHDARFGNLLSRKLRPTVQSGRTVVIELNGWSRQGPSVSVREITSDPVPLRLVS